jgi:hypothetical protein
MAHGANGHCKRRGTLLLLIAGAVTLLSLLSAGSAGASHTGYWYWQGWLPKADGTRTVLHGNICCGSNYSERISWDCSTPQGQHQMKTIYVRLDGGWDNTTYFYYPGGCDQSGFGSSGGYGNYGCQNPPTFPLTYVNCRVTSA